MVRLVVLAELTRCLTRSEDKISRRRSLLSTRRVLRELGERLIGRAHIALAELLKNAYDADAHTCRIDVESDRIVVF